MDYKRIYYKIIEHRLLNKTSDYYEIHHILPKCLGGTDCVYNLVKLTAREHFICHYLLTKMYTKYTFEWYKVNHAFMMLKCSSINQNRYFNSRLYNYLKCCRSSLMSISQKGEGNSQHGTRWICNTELKINKKIKNDEQLPPGWVYGRNKWNIVNKVSDINFQKRYDLAIYLWNTFKDSEYQTLSEFAKYNYRYSVDSLSKLWLKYIPEYKKISTQGMKLKKALSNNG